MGYVYVIGTADTKREELEYCGARISEMGSEVKLVDVSTKSPETGFDVSADEVASFHPNGPKAVLQDDRGAAVTEMGIALAEFLADRADVDALLGLGGSGGTALITAAMRRLEIGVPKVMVSTVASGDVGPYVGPSDITMMYSITDIAGLNQVSRIVLGNAAHATAGMAQNRLTALASDRPTIGLTMFGVTTPLVTALTDALATDYEPLVFHATGTGGRSMEKLVDSGVITAVLDMTTTEIADHIVGGVFSAGHDRLGAMVRTGVPYVGSCGAIDMVNFGAKATVPTEFVARNLVVHNANVTLMRTTVEENLAIGGFIAEKLNSCSGPVRFLLPEGGLSMLDKPGQPFHDPDANEALFSAIEDNVKESVLRGVIRVPYNINDAEFTKFALSQFSDVVGGPR